MKITRASLLTRLAASFVVVLAASGCAERDVALDHDPAAKIDECAIVPRSQVGTNVTPFYPVESETDWFRFSDSVVLGTVTDVRSGPPLGDDAYFEEPLAMREVELTVQGSLRGPLDAGATVWLRTSQFWSESNQCSVHNVGDRGVYAMAPRGNPFAPVGETNFFLHPQSFVKFVDRLAIDVWPSGESYTGLPEDEVVELLTDLEAETTLVEYDPFESLRSSPEPMLEPSGELPIPSQSIPPVEDEHGPDPDS